MLSAHAHNWSGKDSQPIYMHCTADNPSCFTFSYYCVHMMHQEVLGDFVESSCDNYHGSQKRTKEIAQSGSIKFDCGSNVSIYSLVVYNQSYGCFHMQAPLVHMHTHTWTAFSLQFQPSWYI